MALDPGSMYRHRTVYVDRNVGEVTVVHELAQDEGDQLGSSHREGGNKHRPATVEGLSDGLAQLRLQRAMIMSAIAIGRLDHHEVAHRRRRRIGVQGDAGPSYVSAENQHR